MDGVLVAFAGKVNAHLRVHGFVARLPGGQAIDIAVVHAEGCGNQYRVVDFDIGRALLRGLPRRLRGLRFCRRAAPGRR